MGPFVEMDREIGKSGGQGPGSISFCSFSAKPWPSPVRRTSPIGNSSLVTAKKKKKKISKIPSIPPLALIGTPASLAKQSKQRFSNRRNSTPVHHPRPPELTSLSLCSRVDDACSGSAPSRRRRRAQVQCHRLTGAILPSSRPATCDDDGRQCVCPTSQPPLPSAVCPSLPGHRQPGTALRHACTFCTSSTDDAHHNEQDLLQTDPADVWEGFRPDTRAPRRYSQCNTRVNDLSKEGPDWLHTHTTDTSDHPSSIQYSGSAL